MAWPNPQHDRPAADPPLVDGITAIRSRIATIEQRFVPPSRLEPSTAATTAPSTTTPTSTTTAGGFGPLGLVPPGQLSAPYASTGAAAAFDRVFADALGDQGALRPAARLAPGAYGPLQPPAELVAHGNGRIPTAALAPIGDGHHLHAPAAQAFTRMEADARLAGVDLGVISSYRDLPTQQRLVAEKGLYSQGGLAATPGTSNHGWGMSIDLELDARAQDWMRTNGWRYGFVEDVPREPWHWTFRPQP